MCLLSRIVLTFVLKMVLTREEKCDLMVDRNEKAELANECLTQNKNNQNSKSWKINQQKKNVPSMSYR